MDGGMKKEMADAHERVREMSVELNIDYHPQDWGICNGSAERVEEFVAYFEKGFETFHSTAKFELFELVIASFNEAAMKGVFTHERQELLQSFLKRYASDELYNVILEYWGTENVDDLIVIADYLHVNSRKRNNKN